MVQHLAIVPHYYYYQVGWFIKLRALHMWSETERWYTEHKPMAGTSTKHLNAGWLTNTDLIGLDVFCCMSVISLDVRVVECSYTANSKQSAQTHHSNMHTFTVHHTHIVY